MPVRNLGTSLAPAKLARSLSIEYTSGTGGGIVGVATTCVRETTGAPMGKEAPCKSTARPAMPKYFKSRLLDCDAVGANTFDTFTALLALLLTLGWVLDLLGGSIVTAPLDRSGLAWRFSLLLRFVKICKRMTLLGMRFYSSEGWRFVTQNLTNFQPI